MVTRTIALSALMLAPLVTSGRAPATRTRSSERRTEEEVRRVNGEEVDALLANNTTRLRHLWSDDFVVTNPLNQFVNKEQVLGLVTSGVLAFTSYDRRAEYVRVYGNTAVIAGRETVLWAGKMPMAGKRSLLRFTTIWMKQSAGWREVARHANIIPDQ